jgi:hypothetical protein
MKEVLFNLYYLKGLLHELQYSDFGARIGNKIYNWFPYADNITVFAPKIPACMQHQSIKSH